jgi:5'-3' exonuclease
VIEPLFTVKVVGHQWYWSYEFLDPEVVARLYNDSLSSEGDDLLLYWCDYFNSIGENCFIISGDKDLYQLVTIKNNAWTCTWNTNSKRNILSIPKGWKESWLENKSEASIFNTTDFIDSDKEKMSNLLNKIELIEIEDKKFIFNKVLVGDKGDCVPSVWNIKKGERTQTFSQKKADTIIESFIESEWYDKEIIDVIEDPEFLNWISGFILRTSKDIDSSENREKVIKNLIRNFNLMWLNPEMIPEYVTEEMEKETVCKGMRVGLSDKYPEYKTKNYRYLTMKNKIKKQKRDLVPV